MKKLIVIILSVAMLFTASGAAFAASPITAIGGNDSASVKGTYVPGSMSQEIYRVDIEWGSMTFTYTDASQGTWNPQEHKYDGEVKAAWSCKEGANKITVTNHSNAPVKATLAYNKEPGFDDIDGTLSISSLDLATAVGTKFDEAPNASAFLTLSGALSKDTTSGATIGTVTVTLESGN